MLSDLVRQFNAP
jgi:hypothetical protein